MKKIKSLLLIVLAVVLFGNVTNVKAEGKVKVYVFEAGGCPYCEYEKQYLKSLDSYNQKFEIVEKELYVDHVNWKRGKDYPVGKAVAEAFLSAGFDKAGYNSTPFVVISDLYAAAAYNNELEAIINEAYEKGDKDVVSCYANEKENCLEGADPSIKVDWSLLPEEENNTLTTIILVLIILGVVLLFIYNEKKASANNKEEKKAKVEKEEVKAEAKKTAVKKEKAPVKKTAKKTIKKK